MPFLCNKNCKKHNNKKAKFDPKYSLERVIGTLYETSFAEGGGAFKLLKLLVPSGSSNVLNKLLASASKLLV